jgi:predicted lipid-binding transport protein (Tim44 family)
MSGDLLQLLVLAALAAVVLFRLKSVIGTRTGSEAPPEYLRRQHETEQEPTGPVAVPDPMPEAEPVLSKNVPEGRDAVMTAISEAEPGFNLDGFLDGARGAYEMILMAYEEGDRDTLRSLLAPDVYQAFEQGIIARENEGLRVEARFIGVREAKVTEMAFDNDSKIADISIRFVGELITAVRDTENRVVEGDPNEIRRQSDVWTFSREMSAIDPNWLLTGTGD